MKRNGIFCVLLLLAGCCGLGQGQQAAAPSETEAFAEAMYKAWESGEPLPQLSAAYPEAGLAMGYAIQEYFVARQFPEEDIGGYKAAVVGAAGQENLGIKDPVTAVLPVSGILASCDSVIIDLADEPRRALETEIGYIIGTPFHEPLPDVAALREHIEGIAPVIEVPGGEAEERHPATAADLAARNVDAMAIIVGETRLPEDVDVDAVKIALHRNADVVNTAVGGEASGGQWETLLATVNNLVARGYPMKRGQVISNGALGKILPAIPGKYEAGFDGLGKVAFEVVDTRSAPTLHK